jgi:flagellar protein FliS
MSAYGTALRQASQAYGGAQISTAPQKKLLLMLYDGAITNLIVAEAAIESKTFEKAHQKLVKTQDILVELMATLDFEAGGAIAKQLYQLYDYFHWSLVQANLHKKVEPVREVRVFLEELRTSWQNA